MFDKSKFKPYAKTKGIASVSITKNGLAFSQKAVDKLGRPEYIELLVNEDDRQLAFIASNGGAPNAFPCMVNRKNTDVANFRINKKDLILTLANMLQCSLENLSFRVTGEFFENNSVMLIDLRKAERI